MPYSPAVIPSFAKGLNLRDRSDVLDPAEALDTLNVTFTERGAVKSRDGYGRLTQTELTNQPDSLFPFYTSDGGKRLLVGNGARLDAYTSFPGTSVANDDVLTTTDFPHYFVRFGGPTREAAYIANGADQLKRYDLTDNFSEPAALATIKPTFLAVQAPDNRLVAAKFSGATADSNPSTVRFSNAGDPEAFGANDYVQLDPGDGEPITGIATFRELVFVFKQTKFYVFFGNSVDSVGDPVFNFRRVDTGVGLVAPRAVTSTREGVFFLGRDGVYLTTGQEPRQVSDIIDPFFVGGIPTSFTSSAINRSEIDRASMTYHQERVYLSIPTGGVAENDRVLVHDPRYGWWSLWDLPAAAMCSFRPSTLDELVFAASAATQPNAVGKHILRHSPEWPADNMDVTVTGGVAITSRWRSGWGDFQDPSVKNIRETRLWGEGQVDYRLTRDFSDFGSNTEVTFGRNANDRWGGDQIVVTPPIDGTTDIWADGTSPDTWSDGTTGDSWNDGTIGTGTPGSEVIIPVDNDTDTWGDGSSDADLWGPSRRIVPRLVRQSRRGTVFSVSFSHSTINESWVVHRMDHHLRDKRFPNTPRTEVAV